MFIDGIAIGGYRSFGKVQHLGPFKKINIFIGKNNSGKSNILGFLHNHVSDIAQMGSDPLAKINKELDCPEGDGYDELIFGIGKTIESVQTTLPNNLNSIEQDIAATLLQIKELTKGTPCIWFYRAIDWSKRTLKQPVIDLKKRAEKIVEETQLTHNEIETLYKVICPKLSGGSVADRVMAILDKLNTFMNEVPKIGFVPDFRKIEAGAYKNQHFTGKGLIERLQKLQNPDFSELKNEESFENINNFLCDVTGDNTARIKVPHTPNKILVKMNDRTLPLESLGTGIHEVIILATASTVINNQIICMEEPEIHLHPQLQRKLLRYLSEHTTNQYFISTHSAHIIDTPDSSVFHVKLENGYSIVEAAESPSEKFNVCSDLGYQASDIMQSNCIIWVEGPSDRIYLNHWIEAVDENLSEGLEYSIMFYGGCLLSHLSGLDPEETSEDDATVKDFISLRKLNRNSVILMDSDKKKEDDKINPTKARVAKEFNKELGFAWVTAGTEVENYISPETLQECFVKVHPKRTEKVEHGKYVNPLPDKTDKVKVAKKVTEDEANLDVHDLREKIEKLVEFIKQSNADQSKE